MSSWSGGTNTPDSNYKKNVEKLQSLRSCLLAQAAGIDLDRGSHDGIDEYAGAGANIGISPGVNKQAPAGVYVGFAARLSSSSPISRAPCTSVPSL